MPGHSISLTLAVPFLHEQVTVHIDRPAGSRHPRFGFVYPINYGHIPGVPAPDGDDLDAYYLTTTQVARASGLVVAVIHRYSDDDDKLVVVEEKDEGITNDAIHRMVVFQELPGKYEIVRDSAGLGGR